MNNKDNCNLNREENLMVLDYILIQIDLQCLVE